MGRPRQRDKDPTLEEQLEHHRLNVLALQAEITELLDSVPWKPWKQYDPTVNHVDWENIKVELADCVFFLTAIMTNWDITPAQFEEAIVSKLAENYRRISNGYSKVNYENNEV